MLNRAGEFVGIVFAGNDYTKMRNFAYADDTHARTVSVHSRGIIEALRKLYHAEELVKELTGGAIKTPKAVQPDRGSRPGSVPAPERNAMVLSVGCPPITLVRLV